MGGNMDTVGVNKARAVADQILKINPTAEVRVFEKNLDTSNIDDYLEGVAACSRAKVCYTRRL